MTDLTQVSAMLKETNGLTLATVDPDGTPRATPLFFATDGTIGLLFLSDPDSQHSRNLSRDPRAAVGIYPQEQDWQRIRGLQMKGRVDVPADAEAKEAMTCYRSRFPFIAAIQTAIAKGRIYRFRPHWVRLIDNRLGFAYHREWELPQSGSP